MGAYIIQYHIGI
jgi:hypothetical protein